MDTAHGVTTLVAAEAAYNGPVFDTSALAAERTYQAVVAGTGAVTATVAVYVSNDNSHWETLYTFSLSGTTSDSASQVAQHRWAFTKASVTAISGTGAVASCFVGA